jgi:hypothetical protein
VCDYSNSRLVVIDNGEPFKENDLDMANKQSVLKLALVCWQPLMGVFNVNSENSPEIQKIRIPNHL